MASRPMMCVCVSVRRMGVVKSLPQDSVKRISNFSPMSWHIHSLNLKCSWIYDNIWLYEWTPSSCRSLNFFHVNFSFRQSNITSFSASFKRLLFFFCFLKNTKLQNYLAVYYENGEWRMHQERVITLKQSNLFDWLQNSDLWPLSHLDKGYTINIWC